MEAKHIALSDAIAVLREELGQAVAAGTDADVQFPIEGVDLTFHVGVTWEQRGNGKAKFWVLELGADARHATETVQTVTVHLASPVTRDGDVVRVGRPVSEEP